MAPDIPGIGLALIIGPGIVDAMGCIMGGAFGIVMVPPDDMGGMGMPVPPSICGIIGPRLLMLGIDLGGPPWEGPKVLLGILALPQLNPWVGIDGNMAPGTQGESNTRPVQNRGFRI
jgi:hypothetical protein